MCVRGVVISIVPKRTRRNSLVLAVCTCASSQSNTDNDKCVFCITMGGGEGVCVRG